MPWRAGRREVAAMQRVVGRVVLKLVETATLADYDCPEASRALPRVPPDWDDP